MYRICILMPYGEKQWVTLPGTITDLEEAIHIAERVFEGVTTKIIDETGAEVPYETDFERFIKDFWTEAEE